MIVKLDLDSWFPDANLPGVNFAENDYVARAEDSARFDKRVAYGVDELLSRFENVAIVASRTDVSIYLAGLITDSEQVRAVSAFCAKLAIDVETPSAGPFR